MSSSSKRRKSGASSAPVSDASVGRAAGPAPETPSRSLVLVAALSLVPRLFDALVRPIDYNGYWHLFIARNLSREWLNLQHPPLFLVLLKAVDALRHAPLVYRSISLVAGAATVYLVGRVLAKLGTQPPVPALGALATAFASSAITLSNEVESYSLCAALLLGCFLFYLDLVPADPGPVRRSRIGFAVLACLALTAHYFAALFLIACGLAPMLTAALDREYRRALRGSLPRRWRPDLATLLPPGLTALMLYELQAKRWVMPLSSLPAYYFKPGAESVSGFLARNLRETFNLFAPVAMPRVREAIPILTLFVAAVAFAAFSERGGAGPRVVRRLPALFLVLLLAIGMSLGVLGRYPFGGAMRHQFLLLLFAMLAGFVAFDRMLRAIGSPGLRRVLTALCVAAIGANFAWRFRALAHPAPYRFRPLVESFSPVFVDAGVVNVDQFNLVGLFSVYADWDWRFVGRDSDSHRVERYELRRDGRHLSVVAFRGWWIFDPANEELYREFREAFERASETCQPVLRISGTVFDQPERAKASVQVRRNLDGQIRNLASRQGLEVRKIEMTEYLDLSMQLCVRRARGASGMPLRYHSSAARVAELADARDLGSRGETLEGSNPSSRTSLGHRDHGSDSGGWPARHE